jgi:prepilin-type N-terminal cleavage/methylation domain-containing protein
MEEKKMLKFKTLRNNKGFTLVEMLVILLIIGVIVAVLVGIMGNPVTQATVDGAVAKTGDDMRSLKDAMDLYAIKGNTIDTTTTFADLVTAGIITQVLVPSKNASTLTPLVYALNSARVDYGGVNRDLTIELTLVKDTVCNGFNEKYGAGTATIESAFDGAKGAHCFGTVTDQNTIVWPVSIDFAAP